MIFKGEKLFDVSFDKYAESYDEVRPKYPTELFEEIFKTTNLNKEMKVLEIGGGSGIATKELVKTGAKIEVIEPWENLSEILKLNLKRDKNVNVIVDTFENAQFKEDEFDLIVSATSFHWQIGRASCRERV